MKLSILIGTIVLAIAATANAGPVTLVDRGLPTANLNNASGANRSNVAWVDGRYPTPHVLLGDTFQNTSSMKKPGR